MIPNKPQLNAEPAGEPKCPVCKKSMDNSHFEDDRMCDSCVVDKMYEEHLKQQTNPRKPEKRKPGSWPNDAEKPF